MEYISVKEASKKWGISERRVRILCSENRIEGVVKSSWAWNIPSNVDKPSDGRLLRHIKNIDLRVDKINLNLLIKKKDNFNKLVDNPKKYQEYFDDSIINFLVMALSQEHIGKENIIKVLDNEQTNLKREDEFLIHNAKSILVGFYKETGYGPVLSYNSKPNPYISEERLKGIYQDLFRNNNDYIFPKYRDDVIVNPSSIEERVYDINLQMETLLFQYESEWSNLNGLIKASFMFAQLLRIKPFEKYNFLFSSLVFAAILLESKYPLSFVTEDMIDELKANLSLTLSRSNYTNLIRVFEKALSKELDNLLLL